MSKKKKQWKVAINRNGFKNLPKFLFLTPAEKMIWILNNENKEVYAYLVKEPTYRYVCHCINVMHTFSKLCAMYITLLKRPFKCINTGTCMKMLSHNLPVSVLSYDNWHSFWH